VNIDQQGSSSSVILVLDSIFLIVFITVSWWLMLDYRPDSLLVRMLSALKKVDVVVTSGGVSMGEKVSY